MHIPGLQIFFQRLHFSLCFISTLTSPLRFPFFFGGPAGPLTMKIMYLKFTSNRAPRPPKSSPSEDWHGFKWNIPRWQSPKQRHGEKMVIMFEYRVFKLWKKSDKFLKEYLSRTMWPIWVIWIVIWFFTRSSESAIPRRSFQEPSEHLGVHQVLGGSYVVLAGII